MNNSEHMPYDPSKHFDIKALPGDDPESGKLAQFDVLDEAHAAGTLDEVHPTEAAQEDNTRHYMKEAFNVKTFQLLENARSRTTATMPPTEKNFTPSDQTEFQAYTGNDEKAEEQYTETLDHRELNIQNETTDNFIQNIGYLSNLDELEYKQMLFNQNKELNRYHPDRIDEIQAAIDTQREKIQNQITDDFIRDIGYVSSLDELEYKQQLFNQNKEVLNRYHPDRIDEIQNVINTQREKIQNQITDDFIRNIGYLSSLDELEYKQQLFNQNKEVLNRYHPDRIDEIQNVINAQREKIQNQITDDFIRNIGMVNNLDELGYKQMLFNQNKEVLNQYHPDRLDEIQAAIDTQRKKIQSQ